MSEDEVKDNVDKGEDNEVNAQGEVDEKRKVAELIKNVDDLLSQGYLPEASKKGKYMYFVLRKNKSIKYICNMATEECQSLIHALEATGVFSKYNIPISADEFINESLSKIRKESRSIPLNVEDQLIEPPRARMEGAVERLRELARNIVGTVSNLTEYFFNFGIMVSLYALSKTGFSAGDIQALFKTDPKSALEKASEVIYNALESYGKYEERITQLEDELEKAKITVAVYKSKYDTLKQAVNPFVSLEQYIKVYLMNPNADPDVVRDLIDRWLSLMASDRMMSISRGVIGSE